MKWKSVLSRKSFLEYLEEQLGDYFERIDYFSEHNYPIIYFDKDVTTKIMQWIQSEKIYLESTFASDLGTKFELNYLFSLRQYRTNSSFVMRTIIPRQRAQVSIKEIYPNAEYWEQATENRLGLEFFGSEENQIDQQDVTLYRPIRIKGKQNNKNINKYGEFHPIHNSKSYFHAQIENGSQIQKIKLQDGWLYKNIHGLMETTDLFQNYFSPYGEKYPTHIPELDLSYVMLLETIINQPISLKVKYIRMFLAEMHRILSHLYWFAGLADLLNIGRKKKKFLKNIHHFLITMQQKLDYHPNNTRIHYGMAPEIKSDQATNFLPVLSQFHVSTLKILDNFINKRYIQDNLLGLGKLSSKDALESGLTGPALRASGVPIDLRSTDSYLSYTNGSLSQIWSVISFPQGDCYARMLVRYYEIQEAFKICEEVLTGLSQYQRAMKPITLPPTAQFQTNQEYLSAIETPRGAMLSYLRTSKENNTTRPYTYRLITPDAMNYAAMTHKIAQNENLRDFPLILHSLDIYFPLVDL